MVKAVERRLVWYRSSEAEPERHTYTIIVINTPREIKRIMQNVREQVINRGQILEQGVIDEGRVKGSRVHYSLQQVQTQVPDLDFTKAYKGKVNHDRRLQPRTTRDGWNTLINSLALGEF
jgi:hypothetical protein